MKIKQSVCGRFMLIRSLLILFLSKGFNGKLVRKTLLAVWLLLISCLSLAQNSSDRSYIQTHTNVQALQALEEKFRRLDIEVELEEQRLRSTARTFVNEQGLLMNAQGQVVNAQGKIGIPVSLDANGNLVYAFDDNVDAAISSRADRISIGGVAGLNLSGTGIEIGVWEGSYPRPTHQEYVGRNSIGDAGGFVTFHATHTAGTLVAAGIDPLAKGMAPAATIKSHNSKEMFAEIAAFAAAGGILANNSNSIFAVGGVYDSNAQAMDDVTFNAPFYLHVKSAGNNDSPYGSIYSTQLAKNLLVVANVHDVPHYTGPSSVVMNETSSYGPSNDWRIKPDIANNGTDVYSSDDASDEAYSTHSGTSMATPATTGTIALLQEHYYNVNGVYMRAATVKALLINSADEVGPADGPDFRAGWGLVNAQRAAQIISDVNNRSLINELILSDGESYTIDIHSDGVTPIFLTIAWNDPAPAVLPEGNAPALVNDLDVRLVGANTYEPWVMVPNIDFDNYTDPAQKGDNTRDNVEKIEGVLPAGIYTMTVTHKGSLSSLSQAFSLVYAGHEHSIVNQAPIVNAGADQSVTFPQAVQLSASVEDDGLPSNAMLNSYWSQVSGPGVVSFENLWSPVTQASFSMPGVYVLRLSVSDGDLVAYDEVSIAVQEGSIVLTSEDFENEQGDWINVSSDDEDWTRDANGTPSNSTGPTSGANGSTWYLYLETSYSQAYTAGETAILEGPDIPAASNRSLSFYYHMYGINIGSLNVDVLTNGQWMQSIWSLSGQQHSSGGADYTQAMIDLSAYNGPIKLRFRAVAAGHFRGDIAIDDIVVVGELEPVINQAPVVNAGADQTIELTQAANISGSITDDGLPEGSQLRYIWSQVSGNGTANFADSEALDTMVTFSSAGTYTLQLTASDTELESYDDIVITVNEPPPNQAPLVNAGNDQTTVLTDITSVTILDGTVTDDGLPIGSELTSNWSQVSGPGTVSFGNISATSTTAIFSHVGTYVLRLTSSDSELSAYDEVTITVQQAPMVLASEDFENGQGDWINVGGDDEDWTRDANGTPSNSTGPASGANGSTWYLYLETSYSQAYTAGETAILEGPEISAASNRSLSFYYHMYGINVGTLNVDILNNGQWMQSIWSLSGQQHSSGAADYTQATIDLSAYSGPITLRFRAVAAGRFRGDMAIDDIVVTGIPGTVE